MNAWYPMGPRGDKATRRIWGDYKLMALGAKKPNEDVSREFMKWFYQDSNYLTYINSIPIGMIPATSSGQKKAFEHPYYQLFKEEAEVNLDTTSKGIPIGLENGYNLYSYIINTEYVETMLQKVALRDYTAKHAVEMIDAHLRDELEKAKSKAA
jgi:multiple sugar transport system substrate-binding protein